MSTERNGEKALFAGDLPSSSEEIKARLHSLANEIVRDIREKDPMHSQELLSAFVSELFLSATQQTIKESRREKQAKGIAAAKAKGVRFGAQRKPLPDNFDEVRLSWRNQEMNLKEAAKRCGMPATTFYDAVRRAEESEAG